MGAGGVGAVTSTLMAPLYLKDFLGSLNGAFSEARVAEREITGGQTASTGGRRVALTFESGAAIGVSLAGVTVVRAPKEGTQAAELGVQCGWQVSGVDGQPIAIAGEGEDSRHELQRQIEAAIVAARRGRAQFSVEFRVPETEASQLERCALVVVQL